jgi:hypothetical protein
LIQIGGLPSFEKNEEPKIIHPMKKLAFILNLGIR